MAVAITPEQVKQLKSFPRHRELCEQWVNDIAIFLRGLAGTDGNRAGMSVEDFARKRMIAARILNHPNSQDYSEWISQMTNTLKGKVVWDVDLDGTVNFLTNLLNVANYDGMANEIYSLRMLREEW